MGAFIAAAAPRATPAQRRFAADLVLSTVTALGKQRSERPQTARDIQRWADSVSDMLLGYLAGLGPRARRGG